MTARVVLLCGPSGSGKTRIATHSGLPVFRLDDFYKDGDDPSMPYSYELGIPDWDDVGTWHADRAVNALVAICHELNLWHQDLFFNLQVHKALN